MIKNRIDVITLGCSKNLVDSEKLMKQLEALGYAVVHNPDKESLVDFSCLDATRAVPIVDARVTRSRLQATFQLWQGFGIFSVEEILPRQLLQRLRIDIPQTTIRALSIAE